MDIINNEEAISETPALYLILKKIKKKNLIVGSLIIGVRNSIS
jgi:hypothetical protein